MSEILGKDLCPSLNVWSEYLSGQVSDELMLQLSDHLETCSECLLRLSELDSDKSITTNARWTPSPYLLEDEFFRLVVWIENLSSIGAANDDLAEPVQAELPTHFGRFEVNGILGVGAFGRVYAAFDPLLQRNVAIKAPLRSNLGTDSDLANFMNEARHAAALDRDGIVPIYDVLIEESGRALIVMKRINGKSLAENRRSRFMAWLNKG